MLPLRNTELNEVILQRKLVLLTVNYQQTLLTKEDNKTLYNEVQPETLLTKEGTSLSTKQKPS